VKKRVIIIGTLLLLGVLLAFLIQDFVRQTLLYPLVYLYWSLRVIYEGVPGLVWWSIFLVLLFLLAIRSLSRGEKPSFRAIEGDSLPLTRPRAWMRWMNKSNQGDYSKWQLSREISTLALMTIANLNRLTPEGAREELLAGHLNLPPRVEAYLITGSLPHTYSQYVEMKSDPNAPWKHLSLDLDPEEVIAFLETEFER
jgi:hypothetical protein